MGLSSSSDATLMPSKIRIPLLPDVPASNKILVDSFASSSNDI